MCFLLGTAVITKITSNVILKVQKDQITINIQDMERRIDELNRENTSLKLEIQNLQNKEVIFDKMKNEMFYGYEYTFNTLEELKKDMKEYISYYNNQRITEK